MNYHKRRIANPQTVCHLWDAVFTIRKQRQITDLDRIANYMYRVHDMSRDIVERQLDFALRDELLQLACRVGRKGTSKGGVEQEYYCLPEAMPEKDAHDWYCHQCHRGGEVMCCTSCHRVYHQFCVKEDNSNDKRFTCSICMMCRDKTCRKIKKHDLNVLLGYVCNRLKEKKLRDLYSLPTSVREHWKHDNLIYYAMDLATMQEKTAFRKYHSLEEFHADALSVVHNVAIYYGIDSEVAESAQQMLQDCIYDLDEIRLCKDCYRMSNEKKSKYWFCQPCKPPHELVYAKQRGFPFWPAKVIRKNENEYDVRFFGGSHQRANIEKEHIKQIDESITPTPVKRSIAYNRACEELSWHQDLLAKVKQENSHSSENDESELEDDSPKLSSKKRRKLDVTSETDEEMSITSTSKSKSRYKKARVTINEDYNVVSSSSQDTAMVRLSVATQTQKKGRGRKSLNKGVQTIAEGLKANGVRRVGRPAKIKFSAAKHEKSFIDLEDELRAKFKKEKEKAVNNVLVRSKAEIENVRKSVESECLQRHQLEVKMLNETHRRNISETKKKQWCYHCEAEAIYFCCWNTSYCSQECQQAHWQLEHKRTCRRKR